jgi:hypothetical protein
MWKKVRQTEYPHFLTFFQAGSIYVYVHLDLEHLFYTSVLSETNFSLYTFWIFQLHKVGHHVVYIRIHVN